MKRSKQSEANLNPKQLLDQDKGQHAGQGKYVVL